MGFFSKVISIGSLGLIDGGDITGENAADAAQRGASEQAGAAISAAQIQADASREAIETMERLNKPFIGVGERAIPGLQQFIDDPSGASFLQNNPLFNQAIESTGRQINTNQAARGKFGSGGTIDQLFKNYLSTGDQFVNSAYNRLLRPVGMGQSAASFQASNVGNLQQGIGQAIGGGITDAANATSAGRIAGANAQGQGLSNLLNLGTNIAGMFAFSDERLKTDIEKIGEDDEGNSVYEYSYKSPEKYVGYMAQEVAEKDPANVLLDPSGYLKVSPKYAPVRVS